MIADAAPITALQPPTRSRLQRVDGLARLRFGPHGIKDLHQVAPARLLFPDGDAGDFPLAVTVTTSGGLTGGDRLRLEIALDEGAAATVVPQAAEKIYRALPDDPPTRIETRISIGDGGCCEWLAQEAILFDDSRMRRTLDVDLHGNARLLASEMIVLGRGAMGEVYRRGLIHDGWRIRRDGRLIWADAMHLEGDIEQLGRARFSLGAARALLTMVYAGTDAASHLDLAREIVPQSLGGATVLDGLLIVRMMGEDPRVVRDTALTAASALRSAAFGLSPLLPSICYC